MSEVKIKGFWHILATDAAKDIVRLQYNKLLASGLMEDTCRVRVGILGDIPDDLIFRSKFEYAKHPDVTKFEYWTLDAMWRDALTQEDECYYWYIHTKGATWGAALPNHWREALEECVIRNHRWCRRQLANETIGSCGPLLASNPHPFYAGNFFWAKASYVKTLLSPTDLLKERQSRGLKPELDRYVAEEWITQGRPGLSIEQERKNLVPFSFWESQEALSALGAVRA